jgi:uncharacterized protein (TIRG00374 family)
LKFLKSKRLWGLLLAVGLLISCFYNFDYKSVVKAILAINYWYLIPLIFLEAIIAFIRATRLKFIFDPAKKIKLKEIYSIFCIGMMTNLLMPYLTGQVARVYLFSKKEGLKKAFLATTTVLELLFDGLALLLILVVISPFPGAHHNFHSWQFYVPTTLILGTAGVLFALSRSHGLIAALTRRLTLKLPSLAQKKIEDIRHSFLSGLEILKSSKHFFAVSALSILSWLVQASMVYFLILAFNFPVTLWGAVVITVVVTIMMTVVLSPANIGTLQAATWAALHPFGIEKSPALAFSILLHIAVYIPPILLGTFFSFKEGLTFKQLKVEGEKGVESLEVDDSAESALEQK